MSISTLRYVFSVRGGLCSPRALYVSVLAFTLTSSLLAQRAAEKNFNVPGGDATTTLPRFVEQAGEQLAYLVDNVRGEKTNPVNGQFTTRQALTRMLAGTNLVASEDKS